jgi:hypothetical protein
MVSEFTIKERLMSSHKKTPMTSEAAKRIQIATAIQNNGNVPKGSFAAKAQSVAAKNKLK